MKLNVGASRKVTDNYYGSRGASVNLELELDSALVAEPARLQEKIRQLFGLVRISLAEELNNGESNNPQFVASTGRLPARSWPWLAAHGPMAPARPHRRR